MSRRLTLAFAGVSVTVSLQVVAGSPARADVDEDAHVVYCMAQQGALVDAAVALGLPGTSPTDPKLTVDQKPVLPTEWRAKRSDDFRRACDALFVAQKPPAAKLASPSWFASALPFLTALVGFIGALLLARVARAGTLADQLRVAAGSFSDAAREYVDKRGDDRSDTLVVTSRSALANQLLVIQTVHPKWRALRATYTTLTTGDLSPEKVDRAKPDEFAKALDAAYAQVLKIARAVGRPLLWHRSMRKRGDGT